LVLTERLASGLVEIVRQFTENLPLARAGEAAEAYRYLMCGGYTTGQVIVVDGGRTLI